MAVIGGGDAGTAHRAWLDALSDAGALASDDGTIVACNTALRVVLGANSRDLVGSKVQDAVAPRSRVQLARGEAAWISLVRDDSVEIEVAWSASRIVEGERARVLHVFRPRPESADFREPRTSGGVGPARTESVYQLIFDH
ncbi:MAG: PAS domain-containing protein, partial [Deltaproteobacteria bacterium]